MRFVVIEILQGGFFSTVQDYGRYGYRKYGTPISGAMDWYALRVANILVGNPEKAAGIEVTFSGLRLTVNRDVLIAITGGNLSPQINNEPISMWSPLWLKKGDSLSFTRLRSGLRAYVAVREGIDVPLVMNSRSATINAGIGRELKSGDTLPIGKKSGVKRIKLKSLPDHYVPQHKTKNKLSVILGPQNNYFTPEALELFLNSEYTITSQSNRQGYRLEGPEIRHVKDYSIISDAVFPGAIQVPGNRLPIILLADAQTTGGYPKIASVISADLDKIGQAKPSDTIIFKTVALDVAHRLLLEKENIVKEIKKIFWE